MTTFSINALAEILERDRRTLIKALRLVTPDVYEGKGKNATAVGECKLPSTRLLGLSHRPLPTATANRRFRSSSTKWQPNLMHSK